MESIADFLARTAREKQDRDVAAAGIVISTTDKNPDQVAGDLSLANDWAKETGKPMPPLPLVEEYRPVFQQQIEAKRNSTILSNSPKLAEWLRDPQNAALARDDISGLSYWERVSRSFKMGEATAISQGQEFSRDIGTVLERGALGQGLDALGQTLDSALLMNADGTPNLLGRLANYARERGMAADGVPRQMVGGPDVTPDQRADAMAGADLGPLYDGATALLKEMEKARFAPMSYKDVDGLGSALAFISENLAMSLPQMAATMSSGAFSPFIQVITLGGEANAELKERTDLPEDQRVAIATGAGVVMAGLDYFGLSRIFGGIPAGKVVTEAVEGTLVQRLMQNGVSEAVGRTIQAALAEGTTEALQEAIVVGVTALSGGEYTADEVIDRFLQAFAAGGAAGGALRGGVEAVAGGGAAARRMAEGDERARQAAENQARIGEIAQQSAASKLRTRMPDVFRAWVERATEGGPAESLYVPADKFTEYFQSIGMDPYALADEMDGVSRADLETALETGGDLRIPTATYAAKLAGSEADQFFMENMRFDPDEFTSAEARAFEDTKAELMAEALSEAERIFAEQQELRTFEQEIYDTMVERLRLAGRATDVATSEAMLYPAFYRVMAERSGLAVDEFMRRYPLPQVRGDIPQGMQARNVDDLTRTLATARAARQAGVNQPKTPLLEFISNYGGISDRGGELAARDTTVIRRGPFRKTLRLLRDTGPDGQASMFGIGEGGKKFGPDDVAQAAIEAGLMADNPVVMEYKAAMERGDQIPDITRALWDEIDRELRGDATMTDEDMNAGPSQDEQIAELERYLGEIGVSLDDDDATIRAAIERDRAEQRRMYGQDGRIATDSEAFKRWFGDSKVVDENGEPLVVYHGTRKAGFMVFDTDGRGKTDGTGAFFTESLRGASTYSGTMRQANPIDTQMVVEDPGQYGFSVRQEGDEWIASDPDGNEYASSDREQALTELAEDWLRDTQTAEDGNYAVYLSIQNPKIIDAGGQNWDSIGAEPEFFVQDENGDVIEYFTNKEDAKLFVDQNEEEYGFLEVIEEMNLDFAASTDDMARQAREEGFDGVIFDNITDEGPFGRGYGWDNKVYVAFSPTQIKSVNNRGTFDPNDPRILYQGGAIEYAVKPPKKLWRGVVTGEQADGSEGLGTFMLGRGLYSSPDKKFAAMYGKPQEVSIEDGWPRNPLVLRGQATGPDLFRDYVMKNSDFRNMREFNAAYPNPADWVRSLGYDGVIAGDEVVKYPETPDSSRSYNQAAAPEDVIVVMQTGEIDTPFIANMEAPDGRTYGQAARTIEVDGIEMPVNPDGTVTVYHGTTADAADMIVRAGVLRSDAEPSVYVTTAMTGDTGYGDGTVVAVDVMPTMLRLDDEFPDGRADFAIDRRAVRVVRARIVAGGSGKTFNQPAYHGSPHLFEKFSLDKIGTGEGAQAFGWGLYLAGRKGVAEYYRDTLTGERFFNFDGQSNLSWDEVVDAVSRKYAGRGYLDNVSRAGIVADGLMNEIGRGIPAPSYPTGSQREAVQNELRGMISKGEGGRLFEVDIPEDVELLDWDAPLSKQPEAVRDALDAILPPEYDLGPAQDYRNFNIRNVKGPRGSNPIGSIRQEGDTFTAFYDGSEIGTFASEGDAFAAVANADGGRDNMTGATAYKLLSRELGGDQAASEALRAAGIPGHRYLDGGSRADGDGTRNYVIYDDSRIQVTRFEQEQRGSIAFPGAGVGNGDTVVSLFRSADLSTFLHESGHYFLTVMQDMAQKGEPAAVAEFEQIKTWWRSNAQGVAKDAMRVMPDVQVTEADVIRAIDAGTTGDVMKDAAIDVGMQEQFARGFEAYLMDGKAPSVELRTAFEKFRAWLVSIYRRLTGLNVEVSDDIRQVFDRMLATDDEIAAARQATGDQGPMFKDAPAGMSPEDWARYQAIGQQAADEASARLLAETMAPIKREAEKQYRAEKEAVRAEIEPLVNARKEYRAIEWMGNRRWLGGEQPQGLPDMRLDRATLVERYGEGVLKTLPRGKFPLYANEGGVDPEIAAGLFGFGSADEMIRALERAPKRAEAIAAEVEKVMFERHGDPLRDGTVEAKAVEAVHGDKRARVLAIELDVLRAAPGGTRSAVSVFREMARQTLARMPVRDAMASNRYLTAERKAGEASYRAFAAGDLKGAAEAKRRQLLNHMLYSEARKVEAEVDQAEKLAARLQKKSVRDKLAGDYIEAIDELLNRYDFRRLSARAEDRRGALNAYVERMKAEGRENELAIPERVLQDAARIPYKRLTVEHLRGVVDSLKNIEHTARLKQKLIDAQSQRDLDAVVDDILGAFDANVKQQPPGRVGTTGERVRGGMRGFLDLVLNAGTLLREIDGFKDFGPAFANLKAPIDQAMNRLQARREKAAIDLDALYEVYTKDERRKMAVREFIPEVGDSLSKWERIAVALNMGNEGNYQRLTDTKVRGGFTEAQVKAIVAGLDARDAKFVQSVWDYLETFRGDIEAREKRVTGVAPKWVEARPVQIAGIDLRGGYYPLRYDPRLSSLARDDATQDIAKSLQAGRFGKAQTRNGHLKERATSSGRPVELDISVLHRHVQQVVYDLELSEPVANSWRIMQDGRIRDAFVNAGKQADFDALEIWLKDVAEGELRAGDVAGSMARRFKSNFTAAKLAFNLSTVAVQITGVAQSMVVVGKADFLKGVQAALRPGVREEVFAKSLFMRDRATTFNKDIFDLYNDPRLGPVASRWTEIRNDWIAPAGFWLMTKVQSFLVDVPTWLAGYQQGLRKFPGDEAKAIAYADDIVKRSQASGIFSDRSAVERGSASMRLRQNEFLRLFTTLGSYMFAKFNVAYERTGRARQVIEREGLSLRSAQEAVSWTVDVAFLFTLEAVLYGAIKGRLPDEEDDEDDDGMTDEWAAYLAKETALSFMSTMPFVRDIGSVLTGFGGGGAYGAITEELAKPLIQAGQGEVDAALVKSVISATGLFTGLPAGQINRAVDAGWRQAEGEDVSPAEYLLGRMGN